MRILLIGATGFIGTHLTRQLSTEGHEVTIFHRGVTNPENIGTATQILGERQHLGKFRESFRRIAPDVVIDMIAMNEDDARQLVDTFRDLTQHLVVISSADVYRNYELVRNVESAEPDPRPLTEDSPVRTHLFPYRSQAKSPEDRFYKYDKILVERLVMSQRDVTATVLRLAAVYGPGDKQHRLFRYLKRMDDGRPAIFLERGENDWRWTRGYVENVSAAICAVAGDQKHGGSIYNVGEIRGLTEFEWISSIGAEAGWKGQVIVKDPSDLPVSMRSGMSWQHQLETDTSLLRKQTGFSEPISFREGLRRTIAWERENPPPQIKPEEFDYAAEDSVAT